MCLLAIHTTRHAVIFMFAFHGALFADGHYGSIIISHIKLQPNICRAMTLTAVLSQEYGTYMEM